MCTNDRQPGSRMGVSGSLKITYTLMLIGDRVIEPQTAVFHHPQNQFQLENCCRVSPLSIFTISFPQIPTGPPTEKQTFTFLK